MELAELTAQIIFRVFFLWLYRPDPRLPPFPTKPLPIVGNLFHLESDTRSQFEKWRKQCGDIFSLNMCRTLMVVLNGHNVIKEALVTKYEAFSDRPPVFIVEATGLPEKGIVFASGPVWEEQRQVTLSILRKLGMGKGTGILAEKIQEEVTHYVNDLAKNIGQSINIQKITDINTSNITCSMIFGQMFDREKEDFQNLLEHRNFIASQANNAYILNFMPWLKYMPGDFFAAKKLAKHIQEMMSDIIKIIDKTARNDVNFDDVDNLIDAYIADKNKKHNASVSTYLDDLKRIVFDLIIAGLDTTSTTIYWCVLYMLNYPDIQDKVYREIREHVGTERTPNMQDKPKLPYLNAVIMETQRLASIVPLSLPYKCSKDVNLRGYTIPKGTFVIPNLDSVLHDKTIWGEDAMTFRPDRFLDATGKLVNRNELIPFGIGRRVCLGEGLAKIELFLFLSNIFQKFKFQPLDETPPSCTDYVSGLARSPRPYQVTMVLRE